MIGYNRDVGFLAQQFLEFISGRNATNTCADNNELGHDNPPKFIVLIVDGDPFKMLRLVLHRRFLGSLRVGKNL